MKSILIKYLGPIRAFIVTLLKPKDEYFLATRSLQPISNKFGYDRGTPIDRYYIETFLKENAEFITGKCLEVVDPNYINMFGRNVTQADALDFNTDNKKATIIGNLKNLQGIIPDNTYDCLVITHVFGMIDEYEVAIKECYRILKPGGSLLVTVSAFSPSWEAHHSYWRFTVNGVKYAFGKYFKKLNVKSYGNVLSGQCFWVGLAKEELTQKELEYNDPHFPLIVTLHAVKS